MRQSTNTENIAVSSQIKLFPNPTSDVVNVHLDLQQASDLQYHLYDLQGRLLFRGNTFKKAIVHDFSLDVRDLVAEVYVLKLVVEDKVLVE
ncbi:MAG: T9SS type A sorting domain-containing protein [Bacteroidota bacterium]